MPPIEAPSPTHILERDDFRPTNGVYVFAAGEESRSLLDAEWRTRALADGVVFWPVTEQAADSITLDRTESNLPPAVVGFRDSAQLRTLVLQSGPRMYLDITGLAHRSWAPLVRQALVEDVALTVLYVEPTSYRRSGSPTGASMFDLSERVEGIKPLPGFATLTRRQGEARTLFVPLLGFEGARLQFVLEHAQPAADMVVPIVGLPAFRPEFVYNAYLGNRLQLQLDSRVSRVRYARANCPFSAFHELRQLAVDYPGHRLQIAPIGTKPHGLGAILFALANPDRSEIIYDHPVRKPKRTTGQSRTCVFDVAAFAASPYFSSVP